VVDTTWDVNDPDCANFLADTLICSRQIAVWQDAAGTAFADTLRAGCSLNEVYQTDSGLPLVGPIVVDTATMSMAWTTSPSAEIGWFCVSRNGESYEQPFVQRTVTTSLNVGPGAAVQPTEALWNYGIPDKQAIRDAFDTVGNWEVNHATILGVDRMAFLGEWQVRRAGMVLTLDAGVLDGGVAPDVFGANSWWGSCDSITRGPTIMAEYMDWTRRIGREDWTGDTYLVTDGASLLAGDTLSWGIEMTNYWGRRDTVRIESLIVPTDCTH
jgi:hypothetical protein